MMDTKNRLNQLFSTRKNGEKVMSLFITAGYPETDVTAELILGFEKNGTDIIELGMPFSDPLADGPTIQYASNVAIENGITMEKIFSIIQTVRKTSEIPLIMMGYINPILRYGVDAFCKKASEVGADGLIVPDVTLEESAILRDSANKYGLNIIYLVAPNTSSERMKAIDEASKGFVYCVSVTGVTGARDGGELARSVQRFIDRVNDNVTLNPKLIGFGIKNHDDAAVIAEKVDGFIVGSALIDVIRKHFPKETWKDEVYKFVNQLKFGNID